MDLWVRSHLQQGADPKKAEYFYNVTRSHLSVPSDESEDFWTHYCDAIKDGINPHISEITQNRESVQLSYDLHINFERRQIPYNAAIIAKLTDSIDQYVEHVIGMIQTILPLCFEPTKTGSEQLACYLRHDDKSILIWHADTVSYSGRIVFPYAHIRNENIVKLYHFILGQLQVSGSTPDKYLTANPVSGLDQFIRHRFGEANELYGSSFSEADPALILYRMYGSLNTNVKITHQIQDVFTPQYHSASMKQQLSIDTINQKISEHGISYWLPLFFSSEYWKNPLKAKDGVSLEMPSPPKITITAIRENGETMSKMERTRQLLNYVSDKRMNEYWSWVDIGQALKRVDPVEGLALWKWMTVRSDFKEESDCDMLWPTFDGSEDVDIETLEYFASVDSEEGYENHRKPEVKGAVMKAVNEQSNAAVAKAFKACFPHKFLCSDFEHSTWSMYNGNRWVRMSGTSDLMWYLNEKFRPKLEELQAEYANDIAKNRDSESKDRQQHFHNMIGELIIKLGGNGFKKSVCEEMKIYYRKDNFNSLKDRHTDYTATPNSVIDVRGGEVVCRPGKPQDYCTRCAKYDPITNGSWDHPSVKMTMEYLRQVFRSKALLDYVLRFLASLLKSGNSNKLFPIFSGQGNNSKSVLVKLLEAAFGNYVVKLPTTLITGKSTGADQATPSLIHSAGAKIAFLEEPNKNEEIQSGTVKRITGNDTLFVRDLFQKGAQIVELPVSIVPILVANKIPVIPDCQQAIWNRTRVISFTSCWDDNAPSDPAEQFRTGVFKLNRFFDRSLPMMAPALLWILCQMYPTYYKDGLQDPPEVLEATSNFQISNNYYIHFTRDCLKFEPMPDGTVDRSLIISLDEIYPDFKKWYAEQQFRQKMPNKTEFKENIQIVWKVKADADNKWYGWRRVNEQSSTKTITSLLSF